MKFNYNDGGKSVSQYVGSKNDCVVRAISIVLELDYDVVHEALDFKNNSGVLGLTANEYFKSKGWQFKSSIKLDSPNQPTFNEKYIPYGRVVACLDGHYSAVINHVVNDTGILPPTEPLLGVFIKII
jgi:hypothetical protein